MKRSDYVEGKEIHARLPEEIEIGDVVKISKQDRHSEYLVTEIHYGYSDGPLCILGSKGGYPPTQLEIVRKWNAKI